jgi:hypothetical protein
MDHKNIFSLVKSIINKNDPIGLLKQGSPPDEYDTEIKNIIIAITKCKTVQEFQQDGVLRVLFPVAEVLEDRWLVPLVKVVTR